MERCVECLKTVRQNPRALFALKVYSLLSGILLFVAGLLGLIMVFKSPFYIVIGVYAMLFGFTVIVIEHGTWLQNVALLERFYQLLDVEFHMLASQRGKGFFYSGAGVLTLFTEGNKISLIGGASICMIIAGVLHSFRIVHEESINAKAHPTTQAIGGAKDTSVPPAPNYPTSAPVPADLPPPQAAPGSSASASEWSSIVATQNQREGAEDWGAGTAREEAAASDRV